MAHGVPIQVSIGRIKISPEKGTGIVDRVEFKNEWYCAEQHGLLHDGYQGDGALDIKVEWKKEGGGGRNARWRGGSAAAPRELSVLYAMTIQGGVR